MAFDFGFIAEHMPRLLSGLWMTVQLTVIGIALGFLGGLTLALVHVTQGRASRWLVVGFVEFIRNTPFVVQLFFLYFVLPTVGVRIPGYWVACLALAVWGAAYSCENFRAGFEAVPKVLVRGAAGLGFRTSGVLRHITIPVGLRIALPSLGNTAIGILKDTSVLITIGILDITGTAMYLINLTFRTWEMLAVLVMVFLGLVGLVALIFATLERRLRIRKAR